MLIRDVSEGKGDNFLSGFLRFIKERMLDPNKDSRASSKEVYFFLEECLVKPRHPAYWSFDSVKCWADEDEDGSPPRCMDTSTRRPMVNFSNPAVGLPEPRNRDKRPTVSSSSQAVGLSELGDEDVVQGTDAVPGTGLKERRRNIFRRIVAKLH